MLIVNAEENIMQEEKQAGFAGGGLFLFAFVVAFLIGVVFFVDKYCSTYFGV
jgi:hypothetical protein